MKSKNIEAEVEVFSAKVSLFESYVSRAWQRFNWLITVNAGWIALLISNMKMIQNISGIYYLLPGIILALIWTIIGFEDHRSIIEYQIRIKVFEKNIMEDLRDNYFEPNQSKRFIKVKQTHFLWVTPFIFFILWSVALLLNN